MTEGNLLFMVDRYAGGLIAEDVNQATPPTEFWGRTQRQMDVVRALVGSQRSAAITDTIKLLMRVAERSAEDRQVVKEALDHFGHIRVIRDRLVHSGASPIYRDEWVFQTGTSLETREREKAQDYVFRIEDLESMVADLRAIRLRVGAVICTDAPGFEAFAKAHGAFEPWSYKQVQPVVRDRAPKKGREPHHPQPQSPFEAAFSIAASYTISHSGPLMYAGKPRGGKMS